MTDEPTYGVMTPELAASLIAETCRKDGWTPLVRKIFLETLADTGRVKLACQYCQRSERSAYYLRNRDPVFAAGWDAACELARVPLADRLYELATDGVTETISKDGEVVAERKRHDSRLSIAVLHRLDKRCDKAWREGSPHRRLLGHWEQWLEMVGQGDEAEARAALDPGYWSRVKHNELRELSLGKSPTELPLEDRWGGYWHTEGHWWTNYPPPPGFRRKVEGEWGTPEYRRRCSQDEEALLDGLREVEWKEARTAAEAEREAHMAEMRNELRLSRRNALLPAPERKADPGSSPG